jgi:hypothetical protein
MTDPPLSRQMPCCACLCEGHVFACPCGCTVPIPGLLAVLPDPRKGDS